MKNLILASASPRRKELLEQMGLSFSVIPSQKDEIITEDEPSAAVKELSYQKAMDIAGQAEDDSIIIGADTVVSIGNKIMGKPQNPNEACEMLRELQGNIHQVFTGVAIIRKNGEEYHHETFFERTDVYMYPMSEEEIRFYVDTKEPLDKAGAYGIQGKGALYIKKIKGDYNNVVGLPIAALYQKLKDLKLM